jgi:hypothetical protein
MKSRQARRRHCQNLAFGAESPRRIVIYAGPLLLLLGYVLTFAPRIDRRVPDVTGGSTLRSTLKGSQELFTEMNLIGVVLNRWTERDDSTYY